MRVVDVVEAAEKYYFMFMAYTPHLIVVDVPQTRIVRKWREYNLQYSFMYLTRNSDIRICNLSNLIIVENFSRESAAYI